MDITTENINNLIKCLQATLSPDPNERKQGLYFISALFFLLSCIIYNYRNCLHFFSAENFLLSIESNKNYPLLLLHIISAPNDVNVGLIMTIGAVTFKNYIKRNWAIVSILYFVCNYYLVFTNTILITKN